MTDCLMTAIEVRFLQLRRAQQLAMEDAERTARLWEPYIFGPCDTDSDKSPPAANEGDPRR